MFNVNLRFTYLNDPNAKKRKKNSKVNEGCYNCLLSVDRVVSFKCAIVMARGNVLSMTLEFSCRRGHVSRIRRISGDFSTVLES